MTTDEHDRPQRNDVEGAGASSDMMRQTPLTDTAPPTERGDDAPRKRESTWPTVLATLSFIWGGLSLFFSGCSIVMTPFYAMMATMFEEAELEEHADEMRMMAELWWWWGIQALIGVALSVLLIAAGTGLLKRMHHGVRRAKIWSWLIILQLLIITPINVYVSGFRGQSSAQHDQYELIFAVISAVLVTLFTLILPVFFLIWFARQSIKEETAEWPN